MLRNRNPAIYLGIAVLLSSLTACANNPVGKNLEQSFAADPRLKENPALFGAAKNQSQQQNQPTVQLPADFPQDIPKYPNATLQEVTPANANGVTVTRWSTNDPSNFIETFYRQEFQKNNWQIVQQPTEQQPGIFEARRDNLQAKISIQPKSVTNGTTNQSQTATELLIEYTPNAIATATPQPSPNETKSPDPAVVNSAQPNTSPETNPPTTTGESQTFADINKAPQELQKYIQDLAALGVLSTEPNGTKSNTPSNFEPGKAIARRDYARWLVAANNAMYLNNPAKQIRLGSESSQPAFKDVPKTNPDFPFIQGLAEAGLIPSSLSGDSTELLFRPDAPLTREQLILWKIPLDTRQALPTANLEAVKQTWGFQDAGKIDPKALRSVLADHQSGDKSNIRRVFGYTTLFQPKKPVTRAEAAAALWYFGTQGEGISAVDAIKLKTP